MQEEGAVDTSYMSRSACPVGFSRRSESELADILQVCQVVAQAP